MVITLADNSTTTVSIQNGKGISSIAKTGTSGLVDTYTITYNDATTQTFSVTNGAKGDTGDSWYVWIKYAGSQPTQDSDMGDTPDDWIGIYSGTSSTAPAHYTDYEWYEYKGEKGDTGDAATITTQNVSYQESSSGTVAPSGSWTTTIPTVTPGNFLWTRTQLAFNDGTNVTSYSVSRYGIDGSGAVSSVNNVSPDSNGNVALTGTNIPLSDNQSIQTHITDAEDDISALKTSLTDVQDYIGTAFADKNVAVVAGVARYSNGEWALLNDSGHNPLNLVIESGQTDPSTFTVKHEVGATKVLSLVCTPDDGYSAQGCTCGASVGLDYSVVNVSFPCVAASTISNSSGASTYTHTQLLYKDIVASIQELSHATLGTYLRINLSETNDGLFTIQSSNAYDWHVLGFSNSYINLQPYLNGQVRALPLSQGNVNFSIQKQTHGVTGTISHTSCNIWILGIFEV